MGKTIKVFSAAALGIPALIWEVLDWMGRIEVLLTSPTKLGHVQEFIMEHQSLGYQLAPWMIMAASLALLATLQWPGMWRAAWLRIWRSSGAESAGQTQGIVNEPPAQRPLGPKSTEPLLQAGNDGINVGDINASGNAKVGIGKHAQVADTIINQAPPPEIRFIEDTLVSQRSDGTFDWRFTFEIVSASPLGTLVIGAESDDPTGSDLLEVGVNPLTAGIVQFGSWSSTGSRFVRLTNPYGKYDVTVRVADAKSKPKIAFHINQ